MSLLSLTAICPSYFVSEGGKAVAGNPDWRIHRFSSAREVEEGWPDAERTDDFWLRRDTLAYLTNHELGMRTTAWLVANVKDGRRLLFTSQKFNFRLGGQFSDSAGEATSGWNLRRRLLAPFSFPVLCFGQLLTSGPYFTDGLSELRERERRHLLPAVIQQVERHVGITVALLIKDAFLTDSELTTTLRAKGFHPLPVDPVMEVCIRPHWNGEADYLADLTSKYRVRYRRARGKLAGIDRRRLTAGEVKAQPEVFYRLYRRTRSAAAVNLTELNSAYFSWLADRATFTGYFDGEELVGFTTTLASGPVLHAHYLGMEGSYKGSHHLYHNMLYDLLLAAVAGGYRKLSYGRTALEIKSSVGAEPARYATLLKVGPSILNRLVPRFIPAIFSAAAWTARNPFR